MKLCLVSSSGGHMYQLWQLKQFWKNHERFWVCFPTEDVKSLIRTERKYLAFYPESRHVLHAIKNFFLALSILRRERPDVIISTGAGIAPPFFLVAKFLKIYTIYIEPIDFLTKPSVTGKILSTFVDLFLVQNPIQRKLFPRASYWGSTL